MIEIMMDAPSEGWVTAVSDTGVAATMPMLPDHVAALPGARQMWLDRLTANLEGRCPRCGAVRDIPAGFGGKRPGEVGFGLMWHEAWCPVSDDGFDRLVRSGMQ
jgi:hypothetical protein